MYKALAGGRRGTSTQVLTDQRELHYRELMRGPTSCFCTYILLITQPQLDNVYMFVLPASHW